MMIFARRTLGERSLAEERGNLPKSAEPEEGDRRRGIGKTDAGSEINPGI